jgi:NhaA family Na+:H+ antiporter
MKRSLDRLPAEPMDRFMRPFAQFLRIEAAAGSVLLLCTMIALTLSNSGWRDVYMGLWETTVALRWGDAELSRSFKHWIIDGGMTLFFFVIALELKREMVFGGLRNLRSAAFSMAAAVGGMVVPAVLFTWLRGGGMEGRGWGVVMATDTAFVVGCLALLGSRIPPSLRLFLLSLAIFDDIGAIVVIAIGYGGGIDGVALGCGAASLFGVLLMRSMGIRHVAAYVVAGVLAWLALDRSGIHPTTAGMLLGLMTPTGRWVSDSRLKAILGKVVAYPLGDEWAGDAEGRQDLRHAGIAAREAFSPLERLELALHPWVAFLVLPGFALASAGLPISQFTIDWPLATAVTIGLFCGKPLGVLSFAYVANALGWAHRPARLTWMLIGGGAMLTGIGFSMSLLIAELALRADELGSAKVGILSASMLSAACGLATLTWLTSKRHRSADASRSDRSRRH